MEYVTQRFRTCSKPWRGLSESSSFAGKQAMEKFTIEKDIAAYVKKEFDRKHNPTWHAIVGRSFGEFCPSIPAGDVASRSFKGTERYSVV